ncbi:MAG: 7-carboxy-7-deazaguanine synthase QueE [Candidatus Omnitrophica bacterium]|nr:7-carboxy-7-deazaguanine synthase QueE [Candidatus Omnitrophota bacterium]
MKAKIAEIFESIQGEGLYAGEQQLFIRFYGCNLHCSFCDTPLAHYREYSAEDLRRQISAYEGYHSLSLTGGEPLVQAEFLVSFLSLVRQHRPRVYLETNGTLGKEFSLVRDDVDIVAMDIKLPSSTGGKPCWDEHAAFLRLAAEKDIFVKIIAGLSTKAEDIAASSLLLAPYAGRIPVVLQPMWQDMGEELLGRMEGFKKILLEGGTRCVHILPQAHKLAGIK